MKISEIKEILKIHHKTGISLLLLGPPGIGKSTVVREYAEEYAVKNGLQFIDLREHSPEELKSLLSEPDRYFLFYDLRLTEVEPTDLIGYPEKNDFVYFKPLLWAYLFSKIRGIIFLDELTNVQRPDVLSIAFKLLLDKAAGDISFRRDVLVVAAGNTDEHSSIAVRLPLPLISRVGVIRVTYDINTWAQWMNNKYEEQWDTDVYAYLLQHKEDFIKLPEDTETLTPYPCPRTWTFTAISEWKYADEFLGPEVGQRFKAFKKIKPPPLNELINNPEVWNKLNLDQKYMVITSYPSWIGRNVSTKKIQSSLKLLEIIAEESKEFLSIIISMMTENQKGKFISYVMDKSQKLSEKLINIADILTKTW